MEPHQSQQCGDFNVSPPSFTLQPHFAYNLGQSLPMPFAIPPHGFTTMLTSSSPTSPMFHPPPLQHVSNSTPISNNGSMQKKNSRKQAISVDETGNAIGAKKIRISKGKGIKKEANAGEIERENLGLWKDYWVEHLVHIRGRMNDKFSKSPKQGVDLWSKVSAKLASMFQDYDKDSQACRKKWTRVVKSYKEDKAYLAISGNDRKIACKWFDVVDEYMHDKANIVCKSHAAALKKDLLLQDGGNADKDSPLGDAPPNQQGWSAQLQ